MKRLIGLAVAVAMCGLVWGCQKKAETTTGPEAKPMAPAAQPVMPPPPPPPPAEGQGQ